MINQPPKSLFDSIDNCYDDSILLYFRILKWNIILMCLLGLASLPNLIFCFNGNYLFGSFTMMMETITVANGGQSNLQFVIVVICDAAASVIYITGVYYLRYLIKQEENSPYEVSSISPWSVVLSGFPPATIDPDDLRSLVTANIHEIYLARNYQGTLELMRKKTRIENQIRFENKKIELSAGKLTQQELYIRQDFLRALGLQLQDSVRQLSERFNLYLAPDDLESVRAFVVFKSKIDRDTFYLRYNPDYCVQNGITCCHTQPTELMLRGLYTIQVSPAPDPMEIKWENMDYVEQNQTQFCVYQTIVVLILIFSLLILIELNGYYAYDSPVNCTTSCFKSDDAARVMMILALSLWIVISNRLAQKILKYILFRERQIYIVQEQNSIIWRLSLFVFLNTFLIPFLFSTNLGSILYVTSTTSLLYGGDIDIRWILNHGMIYYWIALIEILSNIILLIVVKFQEQEPLSDEELRVMSLLWNEEPVEEEKPSKINILHTPKQKEITNQLGLVNNLDQSRQQSQNTLFLLNLDDDHNKINYSHSNQQLNQNVKQTTPLRRDSHFVNVNSTFQTGEPYSRLIYNISLGIIFSPAFPLLPLFAAFNILMQFYQDKFVLLFHHSYNEQQQLKLLMPLKSLGIKTLKYITIILFLHILVATQVYGYPGFYVQGNLGVGYNWSTSEPFNYKVATTLPLTITMIILLLLILADTFFGIQPHQILNQQKVANEFSPNIEDHMQILKEQNSMLSYNLKNHNEYRAIMISQKNESIRATLNQFKD